MVEEYIQAGTDLEVPFIIPGTNGVKLTTADLIEVTCAIYDVESGTRYGTYALKNRGADDGAITETNGIFSLWLTSAQTISAKNKRLQGIFTYITAGGADGRVSKAVIRDITAVEEPAVPITQ